MSLAFDHEAVLQKEYATKSDLHFALRIPFNRMSEAIRNGKLETHLIDNKIQLRVEDVIKLFFPSKASD